MFRRIFETRGGQVGQYPVLNFQYRIIAHIRSLVGRLAIQNRSFEAGGLDAIAYRHRAGAAGRRRGAGRAVRGAARRRDRPRALRQRVDQRGDPAEPTQRAGDRRRARRRVEGLSPGHGRGRHRGRELSRGRRGAAARRASPTARSGWPSSCRTSRAGRSPLGRAATRMTESARRRDRPGASAHSCSDRAHLLLPLAPSSAETNPTSRAPSAAAACAPAIPAGARLRVRVGEHGAVRGRGRRLLPGRRRLHGPSRGVTGRAEFPVRTICSPKAMPALPPIRRCRAAGSRHRGGRRDRRPVAAPGPASAHRLAQARRPRPDLAAMIAAMSFSVRRPAGWPPAPRSRVGRSGRRCWPRSARARLSVASAWASCSTASAIPA